jgi:hypothetical protein
MRFSAASLLALAASATAAVLPRSDLGSFDTTVTILEGNTPKEFFLSTKYTSEAYPDGLRASCVFNAPGWPAGESRCDHTYASATYDGYSKLFKASSSHRNEMIANTCIAARIQFNVELPEPMTIFGEGPVPVEYDEYTNTERGSAIVPVVKAIA